ncbi:MAG: FixH family protein [Rhizobiaceae bacterium]
MTKRILYVVAACVVLVAAGVIAMRFIMTPPSDLDLARSKATANGLYVAAVEPEVEPVQQGPLHAWIVTVTMPDGAAVEGAAIAVDGGMPQHGHGLPTAPAVAAYLGEGRYRIDGVRFNMAGWWELKLTITAPAGEDTAYFNILL